MRTYERGVEDETFSCGTGVVAPSIAHHKLLTRNKFSYNNVEVKVPQTVTNIIETKGGELQVEFTYTGEGQLYRNYTHRSFYSMCSAVFLTSDSDIFNFY